MAISLEGKGTELRKRLVIEREEILRHRDRVAALKQEIEHTISCVECMGDDLRTCVTYALGILPDFRELVIQLGQDDVCPGRAFIEWLQANGSLIECDVPEPDSLALYFYDDEWRHAAVVISAERVRSKWGTYAVFEHGLSEVSADYGNTVRFYRRPTTMEAARLLFDFGCKELELLPEEVERLRRATGVP